MAADELDDGIPLSGDDQIGGWFIERPDPSTEETVEGPREVDELITSLTEPSTDSSRPRPGRKSAAPSDEAQPQTATLLPLVGGALGMAVLIALGALIWVVASNRASSSTNESATSVATEAEPAGVDLDREVEELQSVLALLGLSDIEVTRQGSTIFLAGPVDEEELEAVQGAVVALGDDFEINSSGLTLVTVVDEPVSGAVDDARPAALERELARLLAATPIVYESGQTEPSELQKRILNHVGVLLANYPDIPVTIVGYTDNEGSAEENLSLSELRADSVRRYLTSRGVQESNMRVEGRGEDSSSGSALLAGLERRVEIEVDGAPPIDANLPTIRVGLVAPSARDDLAFTQSMVDALEIVAGERGNVEITVIDNTFVPEDVGEAIGEFADDGFELIVAHGSQFWAQVSEAAADYPDTTFAWGTAVTDSDLRNVYSYDVAAEEGGYLLGALAAALSSSDQIGVVGPIEVGDAQRYIDGFRAGVAAENSSAQVDVVYTGSFSDVALAAEAARTHIGSGADVLTGSGQMVTGAVAAAEQGEALWIGNQSNQAPMAPSLVAASQVYHWEVILRPIISEIDSGTVNGRQLTAELANGGIVVEYNPSFEVPTTATDRIDDLTALIISGAINPR